MFRPAHIRRYVALMQVRGFDPAAVLEGCGIDRESLESPSCLVTLEQCQSVVCNMIRLSGDSGLGLSLGLDSRITDIGIVGHALMSAKTMGQMARLWAQYGNALTGSLLRVVVEEYENGKWGFRVTEPMVRRSICAFSVEDFFLSGIRWGGSIIGAPFRVSRVQLTYPRPPHAALYEERFKCPVEFDAAATRIEIAFPLIDQVVQGDGDILNDICVQHCQKVMRQIASQSPLISRLRSLFLQSGQALPTMPRAAQELGISVRTLRRRLLAEGANYQALLDQFRRDLAIEYLDTGLMAPKEVAYLLGFHHPSTFRRAFGMWTGKTVGEHLAERRGEPVHGLSPRAGKIGGAHTSSDKSWH